jgi:hypothetical protein
VFWSINMARRKIKAISAKNHFFVKNISGKLYLKFPCVARGKLRLLLVISYMLQLITTGSGQRPEPAITSLSSDS